VSLLPCVPCSQGAWKAERTPHCPRQWQGQWRRHSWATASGVCPSQRMGRTTGRLTHAAQAAPQDRLGLLRRPVSTTQHSAAERAIQCTTVQISSVQYSTVQYSTQLKLHEKIAWDFISGKRHSPFVRRAGQAWAASGAFQASFASLAWGRRWGVQVPGHLLRARRGH